MKRLLLAVVLCFSMNAGAATISERRIEFEVRNDTITESVFMLVVIETPDDVDKWGAYPIFLGDNVKLNNCKVEVADSGGRVLRKISKRERMKIDSIDEGIYSSNWASVIPLESLEVGEQIRIAYSTTTRPYYPAWRMPLVMTDKQTAFSLRVKNSMPGFRKKIEPSKYAFEVVDTSDGFVITATDLPAYEAPDHAPAHHAAVPSMHFGWTREASWKDVGKWYGQLISAVPRNDSSVSSLANTLVEGIDDPRTRVRVLSDHVRKKVRYEAVQIGVGGWVPTSAAEVKQRAWGDCKDKAELLSEMLAAVDIPSHVALVYSGYNSRVDQEFPSPLHFNHLIVAVPAESAGAVDGDPVADGLLFIDPTAERGTLEWLPPYDRGDAMLVINGERSALVTIPDVAEDDRKTLTIEGQIDISGTLQAQMRFEMEGDGAAGTLDSFADSNHLNQLNDIKRAVTRAFSGAELTEITWKETDCAGPCVEFAGQLRQSNVGRGKAGRRVVRVGGLTLFPEPRVVEERTVPVALTAGVRRTIWRLTLPDSWCPVKKIDSTTETELGSFTLHVSSKEGVMTVVREARLDRSWIEADQFEALRELALAESRADKRQIRLRCDS